MGWFSKKIKVQPPYNTLTVEQQRALYFLLEYFGEFARSRQEAINYLQKAMWYLGLSKKDVELLRPYHQGIENLYKIIKEINNQAALDYMVNNTYNLRILAYEDNYIPANEAFWSFWKRIGYSSDDITYITKKHMYRTDI